MNALKIQLDNPNIQHIITILDAAQSLYIRHLREIFIELDDQIHVAESNIPFLKLLVDPCLEIDQIESEEALTTQLIHVIHVIRYIWEDSNHLNRIDSITKLFIYLSNQIIAFCTKNIDLAKILGGYPKMGIDICNFYINCCVSYKIIYTEMLDSFKEEFNWNLDYPAIFCRIDAFCQRLYDILEVCQSMMIFGK